MSDPLPKLVQLKAQARRLRQSLAAEGINIGHSQALELIAEHHGYRDWNTLCARIKKEQAPVAVGESVSGRYLGQAFSAEVRYVETVRLGYWRIRLHLDEAIDVVTSVHFSSFRRQISATVDAGGVTDERISSGEPILQLTLTS